VQTWADYRLEAFGEPYMVWHDGPDFGEFRTRVAADPQLAERMVVRGLNEGDALAAQAIAEADFAPDAVARLVPDLRDAVERTSSTFRVRCAQALTTLTGEQAWSAAIVDALRDGPFWGDRLDAAMALGDYEPTVELIAALMAAMQDDEYLVRYHAANSLLRFAGSTSDISDDPGRFEQIANESTPGTRMLAAAGLAGAASAKLWAGQSQGAKGER
jgi:HEAT repeat protein